MPSVQVTSRSPWHVVVLVHIGEDATESARARVRDALAALVFEMTMISGGEKPYFRVSLVENVTPDGVRALAARDADVDQLIESEGAVDEMRVLTDIESALEDILGLLRTYPGEVTDFTPYVLILSTGGDASARAEAIAAEITELALSAGSPEIVVFDLADAPNTGLRALASRKEFMLRLTEPEQIVKIIPPVGGSVHQTANETNEVDELIQRFDAI